MALSTEELELHGQCGPFDPQAPRDGWEQCRHGGGREATLMRAMTHCGTRVLESSWSAYLSWWCRSVGALGMSIAPRGRWTSGEHTLRVVRVLGYYVLYGNVLARMETAVREGACSQQRWKNIARQAASTLGGAIYVRMLMMTIIIDLKRKLERCTSYPFSI